MTNRGGTTGCLIAGIFGFVYIVANAGAAPTPLPIALRALGVAALAGLLVLLRRSPAVRSTNGSGAMRFDRAYFVIVAGEIVAGLGGLLVINGVLGATPADLGWITLVVGVHFFALRAAWGWPVFAWPAAALTACGVAGLVAAAAGAPAAAVDMLAGLAPGVLLLGASYRRLARGVSPRRPRRPRPGS